MRLCAIDYHLQTPDSRLCAQAKGIGITGLELTRSTLLTDRRWLSQADGPSRWFHSALSMGVAIESLSALFAYEWSPIDKHGRVDTTVIQAVRELVDTTAYLGASSLHLPCLDAPRPRTYGDCRRMVEMLGSILELGRERNITICLETHWPAELGKAMSEYYPRFLKMSLDVGNTIALGRNPVEEIITLGKVLGQVRLRDRRQYEIFRSLPLGHGDVDWAGVQEELTKLSRRPQLVLASTGGASLVEAYSTTSRILSELIGQPAFARVA